MDFNLFTHIHLVTTEELHVSKGHYNNNSNHMYTAILNIIHTATFPLSFWELNQPIFQHNYTYCLLNTHLLIQAQHYRNTPPAFPSSSANVTLSTQH